MNFGKLFVLFAIVLILMAGQSEAGWKKFWKRVEKTGRHIRDGIIKGAGVVGAVGDARNRINGQQ